MYKGIKFVRKANSWCFYKCWNRENTTDVIEWFQTKQEAEARLAQENGNSRL